MLYIEDNILWQMLQIVRRANLVKALIYWLLMQLSLAYL